MDKKKVLFVVHQLNYGGVQKSLISALNALDYDKYDVTLYVRKARLALLPEVNAGVSRIIINNDNTHYYRKLYAMLLLAAIKALSICGQKKEVESIKVKLSTYIAEQKIEYERKRFFSDGKKYDTAVSYIQGYPAKLVADCVDAERKVMFFHGSTDENHDLHEAIFDRMDTIVGVNAGVQDVLERLYPAWKQKMTYIENYVDAEKIRRKGKEKVDLPGATDERIILCTCGRLTPVKGFDLAVKSAKILKDLNTDFQWYFVGDGPERGKLENMIREYGVEENIVITGMQANPYPWINACDIYVQPSYEEAHPLSIIEAQILCKPVVTTATVGGRLLIQDNINGRLSEINDEALARTVTELIHDDTVRKKIQSSLAQIDYTVAYCAYREKWNRLLEG
jgi:glycosyltransferase involved in cell wall biosynthesis